MKPEDEMKPDELAKPTPEVLIELFLKKSSIKISELQRQTLLKLLSEKLDLSKLYSALKSQVYLKIKKLSEPVIYALFGCLPYTEEELKKFDENTIVSMVEYAAFGGHIETIKTLQKTTALDLKEVQSRLKRSPLLHATMGGQLFTIETLLKEYDLNVQIEGDSLLPWAAAGGQLKLIEILTKKPYNLDIQTKDNMGCTVLHVAARRGQLATMATLTKEPYNLDIQTKDNLGRTLLDWAAAEGQLEMIEALTKEPYNLKPTPSLLHWAAKAGHIGVIEALIKEPYNLDLSALDIAGCTILHYAAVGEQLAVIEMLTKDPYNLDPSAADYRGDTLLHYAAMHGQLAVVKALLKEPYKLDPQAKNKAGRTPLYWATQRRHLAVVEALTPKAEQPTPEGLIELFFKKSSIKISEPQRQTLLKLLSEKSDLSKLYLLLESQIIINTKNLSEPVIYALFGCLPYTEEELKKFDENTIVSMVEYAALAGHVDVIKTLQKATALDLKEVQSRLKRSPLFYAVIGNQLSTVEMLLNEYNLDPRIKEQLGCAPLHYAVWHNQLAMLKVLAKACDFDFSIRDNNGGTLLHHAASRGQLATIEFLVENYKLDLQVKDNKGKTLLHWAAEEGQLAIIEALVKEPYNLDLAAKDGEKSTVLHWAAWSGHAEIIKVLTQEPYSKNLDLHAKDKYGCTALYYAVKHGYLPIIETLVRSNRFNIETPLSKSKNTIMEIAIRHKQSKIISWLVQYHGLTVITAIWSFDYIKRLCNNLGEFAQLKQQMIDADMERSERIEQQQQRLRHLIIQDNPKELAKLLQENPQLVDCRYEYRQTPLMLAVLSHRPACVKVLEQFGANSKLTAQNNKTVIELAKDYPEEKIFSPEFSIETLRAVSTSLKLAQPLEIETIQTWGRDEQLDLAMTVQELSTILDPKNTEVACKQALIVFFKERCKALSLAGGGLDYCFADSTANTLCLVAARQYFPDQNPLNVVYDGPLHEGGEWLDVIENTSALPKRGEFFRTAQGHFEIYRTIISTAIERIKSGEFQMSEICISSDVRKSASDDEKLPSSPSPASRSLSQEELRVLASRSKTLKKLIIRCREIEQVTKHSKTCSQHFYTLRDGLKEGSIYGTGTELQASDPAYIAISEFMNWWNELGSHYREKILNVSPLLRQVIERVMDPGNILHREGTIYCAQINRRELESVLRSREVRDRLAEIDQLLQLKTDMILPDTLDKWQSDIEQELETAPATSRSNIFLVLADQTRLTLLLREKGWLNYIELHKRSTAILWIENYEKHERNKLVRPALASKDADTFISSIMSMESTASLECILNYLEPTNEKFLCSLIKAKLALLNPSSDSEDSLRDIPLVDKREIVKQASDHQQFHLVQILSKRADVVFDDATLLTLVKKNHHATIHILLQCDKISVAQREKLLAYALPFNDMRSFKLLFSSNPKLEKAVIANDIAGEKQFTELSQIAHHFKNWPALALLMSARLAVNMEELFLDDTSEMHWEDFIAFTKALSPEQAENIFQAMFKIYTTLEQSSFHFKNQSAALLATLADEKTNESMLTRAVRSARDHPEYTLLKKTLLIALPRMIQLSHSDITNLKEEDQSQLVSQVFNHSSFWKKNARACGWEELQRKRNKPSSRIGKIANSLLKPSPKV